jgi:hypothetical protein
MRCDAMRWWRSVVQVDKIPKILIRWARTQLREALRHMLRLSANKHPLTQCRQIAVCMLVKQRFYACVECRPPL